MKKLYFLNEEEKNRILNLYESTAKRQYLMETPLTDFTSKLPDETSKKFTALNNSWQSGGTREDEMLNALKTFTADDFNKYNQYLLLHSKSSDPLEYSSFQNMINGEFDDENLNDAKEIVAFLKTKGITATYENAKNDPTKLKINSFKIGGAAKPVVGNSATWDNFPCVVELAKSKGVLVKNNAYEMGGFRYYVNGRKIDSKGVKSAFTCNDPEFKTGVSTDDKAKKLQQYKQQIVAKTNENTRAIQKLLGLPETGVMDSDLLQKINEKLNGKPQEAPKADVTTQPRVEPLQQLTTAGVKTPPLTTMTPEQLSAGLQQKTAGVK